MFIAKTMPIILNINILNAIQQTLSKEDNLNFTTRFNNDTKVQEFAKKYIDHLPEEQLYTKDMIRFWVNFTDKQTDRGFEICYRQADKVNSTVKDNDFAQSVAERVITDSEFTPLFNRAKETGIPPDFKAISAAVTKKYNGYYAERIIIDSKLAWFSYLARTKNEEKYWPEYISSRIAKTERFRYDTIAGAATDMNNIFWQIFHHGNDKRQLYTVSNLMRNIVKFHPDNTNYIDTYACLLYKAGRSDDAIAWEKKALKIVTDNNIKDEMDYYERTIERMEKGELIWFEKEYQ